MRQYTGDLSALLDGGVQRGDDSGILPDVARTDCCNEVGEGGEAMAHVEFAGAFPCGFDLEGLVAQPRGERQGGTGAVG